MEHYANSIFISMQAKLSLEQKPKVNVPYIHTCLCGVIRRLYLHVYYLYEWMRKTWSLLFSQTFQCLLYATRGTLDFSFFFLRHFDKRHRGFFFVCMALGHELFHAQLFHDILFKSTRCFQARFEHACYRHMYYPGWCFWVKFGHQVQRAHKQNTCKKNAQQEHILRRAPYHACTCATRLCV